MRNGNPLLDFNFLYELDKERNKKVYARITSLTTQNYPNECIEGITTAGTITIDGSSSVRRVCSLTLTTNNININNIYWGLTTRIKIEIGITNTLNNFNQYPSIIWFPQGYFILTDFKVSTSLNSTTISITGKDKMCLLNGDVGGIFNAETQLDIERTYDDNGNYIEQKKPIVYIIKELIHHYAQENFYNIIINDIDKLQLKMLTNNSGSDFYLIENMQTGHIVDIANKGSILPSKDYCYYENPNLLVNFNQLIDNFQFKNTNNEDDSSLIDQSIPPTILIDPLTKEKYIVIQIAHGEDIGYELTEVYYPDELIAGVGDTVTSILDKIIKIFGAFEYFYNLEGQFVFQAKQNYVNTVWNNQSLKESQSNNLSNISTLTFYSFDNGKNIINYSNNPQLGKIKNDFTVWGKQKLSTGIEIPIHTRYAIDKKPDFYFNYNQQGYISDTFYNNIVKNNLQYTQDTSNIISINNEKYKIVDWREIIYQMSLDYYQHNHEDDFEVNIQKNNYKIFLKNDSSIMELKPYEFGKTGYEHYYHDINSFWRTLYVPEEEFEDTIKIKKSNIIDKNNFYKTFIIPETNQLVEKFIGPWNKNITENPTNLIFWFDFFDANSPGLGQFSIPAIGDRPKNYKNDKIGVITYKDAPDVIFISQTDYDSYQQQGKLLDYYDYIINDIFLTKMINNNKIRISTRGLTTQETIDELLYQNAYCNETIDIQGLPIYYLEPNIIISAKNEARDINGYYIINKISLPLNYKDSMKITAIKLPEKIY